MALGGTTGGARYYGAVRFVSENGLMSGGGRVARMLKSFVENRESKR